MIMLRAASISSNPIIMSAPPGLKKPRMSSPVVSRYPRINRIAPKAILIPAKCRCHANAAKHNTKTSSSIQSEKSISLSNRYVQPLTFRGYTLTIPDIGHNVNGYVVL